MAGVLEDGRPAGKIPCPFALLFRSACGSGMDPPTTDEGAMDGRDVLMNVGEIEALFAVEFPQTEGHLVIEAVGPMTARCRMPYSDQHLRPGGTISGPSLMRLADATIYVAILANVGPKSLTVTTSLNINFLRKPAPRDVVAECRLLKLGKRLAVGEISLYSEGDPLPVAHATATYSIPPRGQGSA
jgi:uncharacterized protein (TIGR00369 family)